MSRKLALATASALVAGLLLAAPAGAAPGPVDLTFSSLDRGAVPSVAYVDGTTIFDGTTRIEVPGEYATLLGRSGDDHVVLTMDDRGGHLDVRRVAPDGTQRVILRRKALRGVTDQILVSADGGRLALVDGRRQESRLRVVDLATGAVATRTVDQGFASPLDVDATRFLYSSATSRDGGTFVWDTATDEVERITKRWGYAASLTHDVLAYVTKDPYLNGCSVLARVSAPGQSSWRSCDERVQTISPDGSRVSTLPLLSDGLGSSRVWVRTLEGKRRATLDAPTYFGAVRWEDGDTVLVDTRTDHKAAWVRCTGATCELATKPRREPLP